MVKIVKSYAAAAVTNMNVYFATWAKTKAVKTIDKEKKKQISVQKYVCKQQT